MEVERDPIEDIINADQHLVYDDSYEITKIFEEGTSSKAPTATWNTAVIESVLPSYVHMDNFILSIPVIISIAQFGTPVDVQTLDFANCFFADMALLNIFFRIELQLGGQNINKGDDNKLRNLKASVVDYKYNDDDYKIIGAWGIPQPSVYNGSATLPAITTTLIPQQWRDTWYRLLQSCSDGPNGNGTPQTTQTINGKTAKVNELQMSIPIPLKYLFRVMRSRGRLPTGLKVKISIQGYNTRQIIGSSRDNFQISALADIDANTPKLYYLYDYVSPGVEAIINEFRLGQSLSYCNELLEEFSFSSENTKTFKQMITIQQQIPTEFLIRFMVNNTVSDSATEEYIAATSKAPYPYLVAKNKLSIADSLSSLKDNFIKSLQIFSSGKEVFRFQLDTILKNGSVIPSAHDILYQGMKRNSYLQLNRQGKTSGPLNYFAAQNCGGMFSFIFSPGGESNIGVQTDDKDANNIEIVIDLEKPLDPNISINILRKIPAMLKISALNQVHQQMWPQVEQDGIIKIVMPRLAN